MDLQSGPARVRIEAHEPLYAAEETLTAGLKQSDASPFIAHHDLPDGQRQIAIKAAQEFVSQDTRRLVRLFERCPALASWIMARHISEHYGEDGTAAIYRQIEAAFGFRDPIPTQARPNLNRAFRKACRRLGLSIPPNGGGKFVPDYVVQAGVAETQLEALALCFHRAERAFGDPPDEDTQRLNTWEDRAADLAPEGLARLRQILWHDETAYHAAAYARLRRDQSPINQFEEHLKTAVEHERASHSSGFGKSFVEPQLIFKDDGLVVHNPPGPHPVSIPVGPRSRTLAPGALLPLPMPWPDKISWQGQGAGSDENREDRVVPVFSDGVALLAFDDGSGRLLRQIKANAGDDSVLINARDIVLAAQQPFRVGDDHAHQAGRRSYLLSTTLRRATVVEFTGGQVELAPPSRPRITIDASRIASGRDGPLYGHPKRIIVEVFGELPEGGIALRVDHPALEEPLRLPLVEDDENLVADLEGVLPDRGPMGALGIAAVIAGGDRALDKTSFWVWPGLEGLVEQGQIFQAREAPPNLDWNLTRNIEEGSVGHLMLPGDGDYRVAQLSFRISENRSIVFEIPRPGLIQTIVGGDGTERNLPQGSTLPVRQDTDETVVVRYGDSDASLASLNIRGRIEPRAFGRSGVRRLSLAVLAAEGVDNAVALYPMGDPSRRIDLFCLAPSAAPEAFKISSWDQRTDIDLRLHVSIDGVMSISRDLLTGEERPGAMALGARPVEMRAGAGLAAEITSADLKSVRVTLDQKLPHGLWVSELQVREAGTEAWMPLTNSRGDHYPFAPSIPTPFVEAVAALPDAHKIFLRLNDALNRCVAQECWESYGGLVLAQWRRLGTELAMRPGASRLALLATGQPLPVDASSTWVPIHHPLEIFPDLYSADVAHFGCLKDSDNDMVAHLDMVSWLSRLERVSEAPTTAGFFTAFKNFRMANANPDVRLKGFDFRQYRQNIAAEDGHARAHWRPGKELLSAAHHGWALSRFAERIERTAPDGSGSNRVRMPDAATFVVLATRQRPDPGHIEAPEDLVERLAILEQLPQFFSLIARSARRGQSAELWETLAERAEMERSMVLKNVGFLSRLGPELLAFYLILWELVGRTERR